MGVFREDVADDLVQDTLASALQARHEFTPGTNLEAWLFTILRNRFRTVARRERARHVETAGEEDSATPGGRHRPQAALVEVLAFRQAFRALDPGQREVLVLVGVEGLTYEQTAAVCRCEIGTVKSRAPPRPRAAQAADARRGAAAVGGPQPSPPIGGRRSGRGISGPVAVLMPGTDSSVEAACSRVHRSAPEISTEQFGHWA